MMDGRYVNSLLDSAVELALVVLSVDAMAEAEIVDSAEVAVTTVAVRTLVAVEPVLKLAVASDPDTVSVAVLAAVVVALANDAGVVAVACAESLVRLEVAL